MALRTLEEALQVPRRPNSVFLMAGGRGQRLRPLTDDCPKPMLRIAGRPILQIIVESMVQQGFNDFYISVNYKRDMVRQHFGDGSRLGRPHPLCRGGREQSARHRRRPVADARKAEAFDDRRERRYLDQGRVRLAARLPSRARQRGDHMRARLLHASSLWRDRDRRTPPLRNR